MTLNKIKSYAKVNLALNIIGKTKKLHRIESLISFINLYDLILIKKIKSKNHSIIFKGKFSKNIKSNNTVFRLLQILDEKKLISEKFYIKVIKNIPQKAGLGGGSMNVANILKYFIRKKILKITKKQVSEISWMIGSDVILGIETANSISNGTLPKRVSNSSTKPAIPLISGGSCNLTV